ncbi:hypothetical protein Ssi03_24130 [Sphaerisporangium siamense]|uniref:Phosphoenolpyruvate synthase n=1 Tax=Sphaerisporangium siamense TaxID=795645 RepID=A0A7W7DA80_9ACTN|nr:PEP/pyruvate-binding domain-containing protein [Sphaerisporangium siamense]MBB4701673.1 phosphohistidine swiveling domain-containing protein [Sphaerisporangium siamense]GII84423.1 hypothetical protein Ssi03_24130 [Sphaerisporangium siamense]
MRALIDAEDPSRHGGKAVALAVLARAGLPVPPGIVLDVEEVAAVGEGRASGLVEGIAAWARARAPHGVVVRSSAPAEDGAHASFAGLFASRFAAPTVEAVGRAVAEVRASATGPAVTGYAAARGLPPPTGMAVLVQPAIRPWSAGVLFTRWGEDWRIEATLGLAVLLVNGEVRPDVHTGRGERIAEKYVVALPAAPEEAGLPPGEWISWPAGGRSKLVFSGDHLVYARPSTTTGRAPALDLAGVTAVRDLGRRATEILERDALDIEWARDHHAHLWLLQARPATTPALPGEASPSDDPAPSGEAVPFGGRVLAGEAASPGVAAGVAAVILDAAGAGGMPDGGVLVCGPARPELVPALVKAAAIACADSGLLCHTAIVARELGKPCVTGLLTAPEVVRDGDLVTVDGDRGLLLLDPDELPAEPPAPRPPPTPRGLRVVSRLPATPEPCVLAVDHHTRPLLTDPGALARHGVLGVLLPEGEPTEEAVQVSPPGAPARHGVPGVLVPEGESAEEAAQVSALADGGLVRWFSAPQPLPHELWAGDPTTHVTHRRLAPSASPAPCRTPPDRPPSPPGTAVSAPVTVFADAYLTGRFDASPLRRVIERVAGLPTVTAVDVWADVAPKSLGVPTGVAVTTSADDPMVYPTAVTDIACGFAVIATGVDPSGWSRERAGHVFAGIRAAIAVTSPGRIAPDVDIDAVLEGGLTALPGPAGYDPGPGAEQPAGLRGDASLFDAGLRRLLADHAGSVSGHFVALYTAQPLTPSADMPDMLNMANMADMCGVVDGELVIVVHTGAPAIRAWAYENLFGPMARRCLDLRLVEPSLVGEHQLFGLPASDPLSQAFLRFADTAVLYGYATRHLCAEAILTALERHHPRRVAAPRLLRHTGHGWYEHGPGRLRSGRGIQPLTGPDGEARPTLVIGADRTHSYLVAPGPHGDLTGNLVGHGIPMWAHDRPVAAPPGLPDPSWLPANTPLDHRLWRDGVANLELTVASLASTGVARPVVRLLPWANYKETRVDAVTRPRA